MIERHWQELAARRRLYTWVGIAAAGHSLLAGSLWFANETNAGKFFDRLPHFFDFFSDLIPRDALESGARCSICPSPYFDGSLKFNYPDGRVYLIGDLYMPEYFYKMIETLNIAMVVDPGRLHFRLPPLLPRRLPT